MGRKPDFDEFFDVFFHFRAGDYPCFWNDKGLDQFRTERIRFAHHGYHTHCRVLHEAVFNFRWTYAVTGTGNQVVLSSHKPEIPILILFGEISREPPFPYIFLLCRLGIFPVLQAHDRIGRLDGHLSHLSGRDWYTG